jgi:hypothetical protein
MPAGVDNTTTSQSIKDWVNKLLTTIMQQASANPNTARQMLTVLQKLIGQGGQTAQQPVQGPKTAAAKTQINAVDNMKIDNLPTGLTRGQNVLNNNTSDFRQDNGLAKVNILSNTQPKIQTSQAMAKSVQAPQPQNENLKNRVVSALNEVYQMTMPQNVSRLNFKSRIDPANINIKTAERILAGGPPVDLRPGLTKILEPEPPKTDYTVDPAFNRFIQGVRSFDEGLMFLVDSVTKYGRPEYRVGNYLYRYGKTLPARRTWEYIKHYLGRDPERFKYLAPDAIPHDEKIVATLQAAADFILENKGDINENDPNVLWAALTLLYADKSNVIARLRGNKRFTDEFPTIDFAIDYVKQEIKDPEQVEEMVHRFPLSVETFHRPELELISQMRTLSKIYADLSRGKSSRVYEDWSRFVQRKQQEFNRRYGLANNPLQSAQQMLDPRFHQLAKQVHENPGKYSVVVIPSGDANGNRAIAYLVDENGNPVGVTAGTFGKMLTNDGTKAAAAFRPDHIIRPPTKEEIDKFKATGEDNKYKMSYVAASQYVADPYQHAAMLTFIHFYKIQIEAMGQALRSNPMMASNPWAMWQYVMANANLHMMIGMLGDLAPRFNPVSYSAWKELVDKAVKAGDKLVEVPKPDKPPTKPPEKPPEKPNTGQTYLMTSEPVKVAGYLSEIIKLGTMGDDLRGINIGFLTGKTTHTDGNFKPPTFADMAKQRQQDMSTIASEAQKANEAARQLAEMFNNAVANAAGGGGGGGGANAGGGGGNEGKRWWWPWKDGGGNGGGNQ